MSRETLDRLRLPIALGLGLMLLAGYMFITRADADTVLDPAASVVVGEPGGGVVSAEDTPPPATLVPTPSPALLTPPPTPSSTPAPTPPPADDFQAEVMACRSIDGAECNDRITRLRPNDERFVALIIFDNAVRGDVMNAILSGPSGQIEGGAFSLQGSGRGYYYSTIPAADLSPGEYTLTAFRNGVAVAATELEKSGGDDD